MRAQHAVGAYRGVERKRNVRGVQARRGLHDQRSKRVALDDAVDLIEARFLKVASDVHGVVAGAAKVGRRPPP
jgi:hypothetical protein